MDWINERNKGALIAPAAAAGPDRGDLAQPHHRPAGPALLLAYDH
jgi:hypothetical protein